MTSIQIISIVLATAIVSAAIATLHTSRKMRKKVAQIQQDPEASSRNLRQRKARDHRAGEVFRLDA